MTDAEQARFAAETVQKVYLGTDKPVLNQDEARELVRRAGAVLDGSGPDVERTTVQPDQEES